VKFGLVNDDAWRKHKGKFHATDKPDEFKRRWASEARQESQRRPRLQPGFADSEEADGWENIGGLWDGSQHGDNRNPYYGR
jgi:hypothetical protein